MELSDLKELHYIVAVENVPSILEHGILCHKLARELKHKSVAMEDVQDIRARKTVPNGLLLHRYANLYLNARNPMMFVLRDDHANLCVLRISKSILKIARVIVTDGNAARRLTVFREPIKGLKKLNSQLLFAKYWTHEDPWEEYQHKGICCAEVLVPNKVRPDFIEGAYVSNRQTAKRLSKTCSHLKIDVNPAIFFED